MDIYIEDFEQKCKINEEYEEMIIDSSSLREEGYLTDDEKMKLMEQNKRLIPEYKAKQLEMNAQRYWDLFYKRNETRFFKNRRWTTREFVDLLSINNNDDERMINENNHNQKILLEVGCGVGNLIFPLIEEKRNNYFYYACDFSPRAIEFVKKHQLYDPEKMNVFQCDITTNKIHEKISENNIDIITMIFVLSAIHPHKFDIVLKNLWKILKPGGIILFRDYGLYDMAQLRFKPGHKISENFYMRQDGTRSYYFSKDELFTIFNNNGFKVINNEYIYRRTINKKEQINVPRIFIQGKFEKIS